MIGRIYKVTNSTNDKVYVGQTVQTLSSRWSKHRNDCKKECSKFYNALNKHGVDNFRISLIEEIEYSWEDQDILNDREMYWIRELDTLLNGYNSTAGGLGSTLFDHDEVIKTYKELKNMRAVAKKMNMHHVTVSKILKSNNVEYLDDGAAGKRITAKSLSCYDKQGSFVETFDSRSDAGRWAIKNGLSIQSNPRHLATSFSKGIKTQGCVFKHYWLDGTQKLVTIKGGKIYEQL